jgi:hypothetical protein
MKPLIHSKPSNRICEAGGRNFFAHQSGPMAVSLFLRRVFYDMNFDDWQAGAGTCDGKSMASTTGSREGTTKQERQIQTGGQQP